MKKVLIALFVALVLFCASGGLERFALIYEENQVSSLDENNSAEFTN